jgi:hypothetical protein
MRESPHTGAGARGAEEEDASATGGVEEVCADAEEEAIGGRTLAELEREDDENVRRPVEDEEDELNRGTPEQEWQ